MFRSYTFTHEQKQKPPLRRTIQTRIINSKKKKKKGTKILKDKPIYHRFKGVQ